MIEIIKIVISILLSTVGLFYIIDNISNCHVDFGVKLLILYFWISSFLPFFLVPLDFSFFSYNSDQKLFLSDLWKVYYFLNLTNSQLLLPLVIYYVRSGYVTRTEKILYSAKRVLTWIAFKLTLLGVAIILGLLIASFFVDLDVDFLSFLKKNAINWLNTS
jgi:hypothetical protein